MRSRIGFSVFVASIAIAIAAYLLFPLFGNSESRLKLGVDLVGGHQLVLVPNHEQLKEISHTHILDAVKSQRGTYRAHTVTEAGLDIEVRANSDVVASAIQDRFAAFGVEIARLDDSLIRVTNLDSLYLRDTEQALGANILVLNQRLNAMGASDITVYALNAGSIGIEAPLTADIESIKAIITSTSDIELYYHTFERGRSFAFGSVEVTTERHPFLTSEHIRTASAGINPETMDPFVSITLSPLGGAIMERESVNAVGEIIVTIMREQHYDGRWQSEDTVLSMARIREPLSSQFQISGLESFEEASHLAIQLQSGSMVIPMRLESESTISPSIGADNVERGVKALAAGLLLMLLFVLGVYRMEGMVVMSVLVLSVSVILLWMALLGVVLTLSGLAGIILAIGIAVDCNILVLEQSKQTGCLVKGFQSMERGILHANVTSLLASVVLYQIGDTMLKGFAVALGLGVVASLLCCFYLAYMGARWYSGGLSSSTHSMAL